MSSKVTAAERLADGVVITFEDGTCAFYSAALLYETSARARDVSGLTLESDALEAASTDGPASKES